MTLAEALHRALSHHQAGRLAEAEQIYRQILQADPRHADALHLLGVAAYQSGRNEAAVASIRAAIAVQPGCAAYHHNLGLVHRADHKLGAARSCQEEALRLDPHYAAAHTALGHVLQELGQPAAAAASYRRALGIQPGSAEAWHGLGKLLQDLGQLAEAGAAHDEAARLQPGLAEAHFRRGEIFEDLGRLPEALAAYQQAVRCRADHVEAHHNAGVLLEDLGRHAEALAWWEQPLRTAADDGARMRNLLASPAIFASARHMQRQRQRLEEGLALLEQQDLAIADPLTQVNTTNFYAAYHGVNDRGIQARIAALYLRATPTLAYVAPHCRQPLGAWARKGTGLLEFKSPVPFLAQAPSDTTGRPLRVGFVSRFLHMHTIGDVNVGILRGLSREVCRVVLLQPPGPDDPLARLIRAGVDEVVTLTPSLETARAQIAEQRLDVLFYTDIGMEPFTYFLAFARLAPVQCVTWGHPMTTGIPALDYYVSGIDLEPPDAQEHYTEQLVRLKGLPTFYHAPAFFSPAKTRLHFGLAEEEHVYLCPQAPFKVHPDYDAVLGAILRGDPRGRVYFVRSHNPAWTHQLLRRLRRSLPDVIDRIGFLPHQGGQDYLHLLNVCDVLLDTTHFGGGNTTYKALSVAAPIVTLPGALARGRVTSACYRQMGVTDCIAEDPAMYVRIALRLANDPEWRADVRARLRAATSALYEDARVLRELEQFFVEAVGRARPVVD